MAERGQASKQAQLDTLWALSDALDAPDLWDFTREAPWSEVCESPHIWCTEDGFIDTVDLSDVPALADAPIKPFSLLSELPALDSLIIFQNPEVISGPGLRGSLSDLSLPSFPGLGFLDLCPNSLSGPLPPELGTTASASTMRRLYLCENSFTGPLPKAWGQSAWSQLSVLDLSSNHLEGILPNEWASAFPVMEDLDLSVNMFSGPLPGAWSAMATDSVEGLGLYIDDNFLSGELPSSFGGQSSPFTEISVENNFLSGSFPSTWSTFPYLQLLYLSNNTLVGPLPEALGSGCDALEKLVLRNNLFDKNIPMSWSQLPSLQLLDLSFNLLEGDIPSEFSNTPMLSIFNAQGNALSGGLEGILQNPTVKAIDLRDNEFSGPLVAFASVADSVVNVKLSGNRFNPEVAASTFRVESSTRKTTLIVDVRGMDFACPFPSDFEIRAAQYKDRSIMRVMHDPCGTNYKSFLLHFVLPCLVVLGVGMAIHHAFLRKRTVAIKPIASIHVQVSATSLKRWKIIRMVLYAIMLYDIINDIAVYRDMVASVDYDTYFDVCAAVDNKDQFLLVMPWTYLNPDGSDAPSHTCDNDDDYYDDDDVSDCKENDYSTFAEYLELMGRFFGGRDDADSSFDDNIEAFAALCNNLVVIDGSIRECSYIDDVEGEERCARVRNLQREKMLWFKPFILASIAVVVVKEFGKAVFVLYVWRAFPLSRDLGPCELSLVTESPLYPLLFWKREGFILNWMSTRRNFMAHTQVFFVEDVVENINQVALTIYFSLSVSQEGISFAILISIALSVAKLARTVVNVRNSLVMSAEMKEAETGVPDARANALLAVGKGAAGLAAGVGVASASVLAAG